MDQPNVLEFAAKVFKVLENAEKDSLANLEVFMNGFVVLYPFNFATVHCWPATLTFTFVVLPLLHDGK